MIAKVAFGIETNASENADHEFVRAGNGIVKLMQASNDSNLNKYESSMFQMTSTFHSQSDNWLQTILVSTFIGYFPRLMNWIPDKRREQPPQKVTEL